MSDEDEIRCGFTYIRTHLTESSIDGINQAPASFEHKKG